MSDSKYENRRTHMVKMLTEREEFLVIGLTGRVGSGCSGAADILASSFEGLKLPVISSGNGGMDDKMRDRQTIQRYTQEHWLPFNKIRVRTIISTFLLANYDGFLNDFNSLQETYKPEEEEKNLKKEKEEERNLKSITEKFRNALEKKAQEVDLGKSVETLCAVLSDAFQDQNKDYARWVDRLFADDAGEHYSAKKILGILDGIDNPHSVKTSKATHGKINQTTNDTDPRANPLKYLYTDILKTIPYNWRRDYCGAVDQVLYDISALKAHAWVQKYKDDEKIWDGLKEINDALDHGKPQRNSFTIFVFVHDLMPAFSAAIHDSLKAISSLAFTKLYQGYGNSIRRFGRIIFTGETCDEMQNSLDEPQREDTFAIPRKINQFIKALRHPSDASFNRPARVVIDSLKNPWEADYLRVRYSAFYLFAITMEDSVRIQGLLDSKRHLTRDDIKGIDCYENSSRDNLGEAENNVKPPLKDWVRGKANQEQTQSFLLQDVEKCIQSADVFISNKEAEHKAISQTTFYDELELTWDLVRNVTLMLYPGLVLPTPIERCMQIAFSAKANSGCLSRQVGAVVTDAEYRILSIGWNDVPRGDITCLRKNVEDLCKKQDIEAYSDYERGPEFQERIKKCEKTEDELQVCLCGLPHRYCFKDVHASKKNPMRSRAMHAEEKALAACGYNCEGGNLFTTSSPCEMCSKNAKDHRIKNIYYIEPYPGISQAQYSYSGQLENRANHILFTGAIGRAYSQMYTPLMPHKDILRALGVDPEQSGE